MSESSGERGSPPGDSQPPPAALPSSSPTPACAPDTAGLRVAPAGAVPGAPAASLTGTIDRVRALLSMREDNFFLLLAVIIGLFSGLAVVCFRIAIDYTRLWLLGSALAPGPWRVILVPTLAGLVLAFVVLRFFPRVRGSGVTQTKSAVYIYDGYIPFDTVIGKFLTCALAIGSGQSLGPEDPSLQMGAGIASALGRRLHLSREKLRLLAPVGAAAGLAAAFNSPIAAVLFVIEEVIGTWSAGILGAVVLSAVASVVVARLFLGAEPLFQIPPYRMAHPAELVTYAVLGVVGGLSSLVFVKLLAYIRPRVKAMPRWTYYFQPALAGLAIGIIGLKFPQVMGAGYEYMDQAMHGQFLWHDAGGFGFAESAGHLALAFERRARRNVRAHSFRRRHGGRGGGHAAAPVFSRVHGTARFLRSGGHGHAFRGLPARAHDLGVHGARSERKLFDHPARIGFQYNRLPDRPAVPAHATFRFDDAR